MDIAAILRRQLELVEADRRGSSMKPHRWVSGGRRLGRRAVNHVLDGVLNEKAVHICFGNYGGQPMLRGFWRDLIPFLNSSAPTILFWSCAPWLRGIGRSRDATRSDFHFVS